MLLAELPQTLLLRLIHNMPKVLESPVNEFPGTITLPDHWNLEQCLLWESVRDEVEEIAEKARAEGKQAESLAALYGAYTKAFPMCLESRDIQGWGDFFPFTPRMPSAKLIKWIADEMNKYYYGIVDVPNG